MQRLVQIWINELQLICQRGADTRGKESPRRWKPAVDVVELDARASSKAALAECVRGRRRSARATRRQRRRAVRVVEREHVVAELVARVPVRTQTAVDRIRALLRLSLSLRLLALRVQVVEVVEQRACVGHVREAEHCLSVAVPVPVRCCFTSRGVNQHGRHSAEFCVRRRHKRASV